MPDAGLHKGTASGRGCKGIFVFPAGAAPSAEADLVEKDGDSGRLQKDRQQQPADLSSIHQPVLVMATCETFGVRGIAFATVVRLNAPEPFLMWTGQNSGSGGRPFTPAACRPSTTSSAGAFDGPGPLHTHTWVRSNELSASIGLMRPRQPFPTCNSAGIATARARMSDALSELFSDRVAVDVDAGQVTELTDHHEDGHGPRDSR